MKAAVGSWQRGTNTALEKGTGLEEEWAEGRDGTGAEQWNRLIHVPHRHENVSNELYTLNNYSGKYYSNISNIVL